MSQDCVALISSDTWADVFALLIVDDYPSHRRLMLTCRDLWKVGAEAGGSSANTIAYLQDYAKRQRELIDRLVHDRRVRDEIMFLQLDDERRRRAKAMDLVEQAKRCLE